ncbi:transcription factor S-II [Encephalitozoon hellem]|uniref:DNA-directed RNA polymerase subunit n=1 Tax=Encephalitozoon hellem TaxID=27973 RepID=A0A9Q9F8Y2_ENCHE|nr:DNA-directed RNA polymerase subunit M [Encephalitozoon hellem ATCC 50504]AFM97937.1 DNA-directed RNA polymerase subunit M [Encephalitozoon hellem ATCC 50504]KAG5859309.1 transcription factor S-II [Encephalitozoon hellem]UTX42741.1 transcription factor S-II [Encephalitozoon hellem]WEL38200.1 transcription factor S-II [Encephalitozoon hellem]|eukprot:XP_003886918.1 DNA-directed RNA polymerase subunit M [Encephalitozoon hellem ATCC 50504]
MLFCPLCSSMLVVRRQSMGNELSCRMCGYLYAISKEITKSVPMTPKKSDGLIDEDENLKFVSKCGKKCECGSEEVSFVELQTRSADEPMTIFYKCIRCKKVWRE